MKIVCTCFFICFLFNYTVAQTSKNCNIRISQFRYANGTEIAYGDTVKGVVNIKNLGPDTISANEFIIIGKSTSPSLAVYDQGIIPGDSVDLDLFWVVNGQQTDSIYEFCAWRTISDDTTINIYDDFDQLNDTTCVSILLKGNSVGIASSHTDYNTLKIFPNPVRSNDNLKIFLSENNKKYETIKFELFDISGRSIKKKIFKNKYPNFYLLTDLDCYPGLYHLILKDENNKILSRQKLLVTQ